MPSATATKTAKDLVPAFDFNAAAIAIAADPGTKLGDLLAELATLPDPKQQKKADLAVVERVGENLMRNISELPTVFGKVDPKSARSLNKTELAELLAEKERIDAVEKDIKKRKDRIHAILSDHFDGVARRQRLVDENTPQDDKGHYLLASKGKPETQPVEGSGKYFTRERSSDTTVFSMDLLEAALAAGDVSRADYLAVTRPVRTREIDEEKIKRMFLSKKQLPRVQEILSKISVIKRGRLSINLRGK